MHLGIKAVGPGQRCRREKAQMAPRMQSQAELRMQPRTARCEQKIGPEGPRCYTEKSRSNPEGYEEPARE